MHSFLFLISSDILAIIIWGWFRSEGWKHWVLLKTKLALSIGKPRRFQQSEGFVMGGSTERNTGASGSASGRLLPHPIPPVSVLGALLFHSCPMSLISLPSRSVPVTIAVHWRFPALPYLSSRECAVISTRLYFGSAYRELSHGCPRCFAKAGGEERQSLPWRSYVLQALITMGMQHTKI